MVGKQLIIWLENGQTLKFVGVEDFTIHANMIGFTYYGVSTGVQSKGRFKLDMILGYSLSVHEHKFDSHGGVVK